jgi:DNA-binding MarR family transcriptional regulator
MIKKQLHSSDPAIAYMQAMRKFMRLSTGWVNVVAESLGVNSTDLIAGSYLSEMGAMTAGELAKALGITTGAMTVAIDRLERIGFATRENDPHDRRKVIIKPTKLPAKLLAIRESATKNIRAIFSRYTDAEVSRTTETMRDITAVFEKEISHFKRSLPKPDHRRKVRKK